MQERLTVITTIRIRPSQVEKINSITGELGIKQNRLIGALIDLADVDALRSALQAPAETAELVHATPN